MTDTILKLNTITRKVPLPENMIKRLKLDYDHVNITAEQYLTYIKYNISGEGSCPSEEIIMPTKYFSDIDTFEGFKSYVEAFIEFNYGN